MRVVFEGEWSEWKELQKRLNDAGLEGRYRLSREVRKVKVACYDEETLATIYLFFEDNGLFRIRE